MHSLLQDFGRWLFVALKDHFDFGYKFERLRLVYILKQPCCHVGASVMMPLPAEIQSLMLVALGRKTQLQVQQKKKLVGQQHLVNKMSKVLELLGNLRQVLNASRSWKYGGHFTVKCGDRLSCRHELSSLAPLTASRRVLVNMLI